MEWAVRVGLALARPPREDAAVWVWVAAESRCEAEVIACQMAMCVRGAVMPVSARTVDAIV